MAKPASAKKRRPRSWDPEPLEDRGPETLFTPREAANYLGIPARRLKTVAESIALGIPVVKVGGANRWRKADLDAYIESRVIPAKSEQS